MAEERKEQVRKGWQPDEPAKPRPPKKPSTKKESSPEPRDEGSREE